MCLSVPAKILSIENETGIVSVGGSTVSVCLQLIENAEVGDYVLVHTGFALEKISETEALETLRLIDELDNQSLK